MCLMALLTRFMSTLESTPGAHATSQSGISPSSMRTPAGVAWPSASCMTPETTGRSDDRAPSSGSAAARAKVSRSPTSCSTRRRLRIPRCVTVCKRASSASSRSSIWRAKSAGVIGPRMSCATRDAKASSSCARTSCIAMKLRVPRNAIQARRPVIAAQRRSAPNEKRRTRVQARSASTAARWPSP